MADASSERSFQRPQQMQPARQGVYILFYDGDCGLCTFFRNWVHRLDRARRVRSFPLASPEADEYLGDVDDSQRYGSMHIIGPDGGRSRAGMALLRLIEAMPFGYGLARLLANRRTGIMAVETVYILLVRIRDQFAR